MKLERTTNRAITFVMTIGIISISVLIFVIIFVSLKKVYIDSLEDMTSVATDNIQELIDINKNEAVFITQMESFVQYISALTSEKANAIDTGTQKNQIYDYIRKKVETSATIDKITIIDNKNTVICANESTMMLKPLPVNREYEDSKNSGLGSITIQKNQFHDNIILITYPVKQYSSHFGYIFIELNFGFIESYINNYAFGDSGNLFLMTKDQNFIGKQKSQLPTALEDISNNDHFYDFINNEMSNKNNIYSTHFKTNETSRYMIYKDLDNLDAILASSIEKQEVNKTAIATAIPLLFLLVVILIMLISFRYIISTKILHPINLLNRSLYRLKKGDLRARYNYNTDNEFGNLSIIFNQTISNLQKTTQSLKERETKNDILLSNVTDAIWEYYLSEDKIVMPENWGKLIGYEYFKNSYTYNFDEYLEFVHINDANEFKECIQNCNNTGEAINFECQIKRVDNTFIWIKINGSCMYNFYNEPYKIIGSISDITQSKSRENQLIDTTKRDDMTKLYNKREMEMVINHDMQTTTFQHYLLIIDIDGFKLVNDTHGHLIGDEVIIHTANVIRKYAQSSCEVCRFGGDEFIVYTKEQVTLEKVETLAKLIINELNEGYTPIGQSNIYLACSIGVSQFPEDGTTYVELMEKADLAIYLAKHEGKNRHVIYNKLIYR